MSARSADLIERPRLKRGHELALVDDARLKCEQSEEKMAIGGGGHGEAPGHDVITATTDHGHGALVARERRDESIVACTCGPCIPAGLPFRCGIDWIEET